MNIAIVGTGYVGLVSGTFFAKMGVNVTCVDIDKVKISVLLVGNIPIYEPGLDELFCKKHKEGRLNFTTDLAACIDDVDIVFSAVGTPPDEDGSADLQYVLSVARTFGKNMTHTHSTCNEIYCSCMYLDNELIDVEHICCMAHARAKFKYALEQGGDKDAEYFLKCMGELYKLEAEYERGNLSAEQIGLCRQKLKTKEVVIRLQSKLDAMLSENHSARGELMEKAIRYLHTFWTQLFAYLKDGRYSIDNSVAECFIRPLAGERKNSLFSGCDRMANVSAAYHAIISTCKMHGISSLEFFKKFFHEIVLGRRDYEHLLPMTIGIQPNKY